MKQPNNYLSLHKRSALVVCFTAIAFLWSCGHKTKSEIDKLVKDTQLSDAQVIQKMAESAWIFKTENNRNFKAHQKPDGKYILIGSTIDTIPVTTLTKEQFVRINMQDDAKYIWRTLSGGEKRGLDEVVYSHWVKVGGDMELYRVRVSIAMLDNNVPSWRTADLYSVGDHDILDTDDAKQAVKDIVSHWIVELDNTAALTVGGRQ